MGTKIIIQKGWEEIARYDFLINMSKGDVIEMPDGYEYIVDFCMLDLEENKMQIIVN